MISRILLIAALPVFVAVPAIAQQSPAPPTKPVPAAPKGDTTKPASPKAAAPKPPAAKPAAQKAAGPKSIGTFEDWTAATHQEAGQTVCYAFTRAQSSIPALPGRGAVVLTVTHRTSGRDAVAIEAGFAFAANALVEMQADQTGLDFYTSQRAAFARNGHAAVTALQAAGRAIVRSPGPRDTKLTDTFSLKGFSAAYTAISKACPAT